MKTKIKNLYSYAISHKKFSALILAVLILAAYAIFKPESSEAVTQYVFARVQKQDVSVSVTGSGQVSALDQVDVSSQVSGTVDYVGVKAGDAVKKGKVIAGLDSADARRAVDNADLNLTNAEIAYGKAQKLYENQLGKSTTTVSDLNQAIDDGFTAVSNAFIDLPKIFMDVGDIYYDPTNSPYFSDINIMSLSSDTGIKYKYEAGVTFDSAKKDYETVFAKYKSTSANSSQRDIVALISQTRDLVKKLSSSLTGTYNTIDYLSDRMTTTIPAEVAADKTLLSSYITKTVSHASKLSDALTAIEDAEDGATTAQINLKSAELSLNQAQDALKKARETLSDHTIVAPFDGVIAKVPVEAGDQVSSNANIATVITNSMKVTISLNEVDAAKVKIGDKAVLNFDAIEDLTMEGTVYEIDVVGTVNSGVVSYGVSISFDNDDARIKAGMTTSVVISTGSVSGVLAVPSSAISSSGGKSVVLVPASETSQKSTADKSTLKEVEIQTGLSGDELTEIVGGLSEGDVYVASTKTTAASKESSGSLFSMFGNKNSQSGTRTTSTGSAKASTAGSANIKIQTGDMPAPPK